LLLGSPSKIFRKDFEACKINDYGLGDLMMWRIFVVVVAVIGAVLFAWRRYGWTPDDALKYAPLIIATIAFLAAVAAFSSLYATMIIARRRAAVDFFLKTEMDKVVIEFYDEFKTCAPKLRSPSTSLAEFTGPPENRTEPYKKVRAFLNICELIAVGVSERVLSDRVSYAYWGDVIPRSFRDAKHLIDYIRNDDSDGSEYTYLDLERLSKRWEAREARHKVLRMFLPYWLR
jgi:hypothetical protein